MKEHEGKNPGFEFLRKIDDEEKRIRWKKLLDYTACMCPQDCSHKVFGAAQDFIELALPYERKFLNPTILLADLAQLHADRRKEGILGKKDHRHK